MATILIVDDRPINREFLVTLLGYKGHRLREAADGAEALERARLERPDLIISDILMPTMDGYEFVSQLRAEPALARTPVIFYTAHYLQHEAETLARRCGVTHILTKPSKPAVVLSTVEAALAAAPPPAAAPPAEEFEREHRHLITNKLSQKVNELSRINQQLAKLIDLNLQPVSTQDPRQVLQSFCHAAREFMGASYATLSIHHQDAPLERHFFSSGLEAELAAQLGVVAFPLDTLVPTLAQHRPYHLHNYNGDPEMAGFPAVYPPFHTLLAAPIVASSQGYGWFCWFDKVEAEAFTAADEQTAILLTSVVGRVYENWQLYAEVRGRAEELEQEVAERQRVEEALRESEEKYRAFFQSSLDAILLTSPDGSIMAANPAACKMLGRTEAEICALGRQGLVDTNDPGVEVLLAERARTGQAYGELTMFRNDGSPFPVEISSALFRDQQGHTRTSMIIRDITRRKQAEVQIQVQAGRLQVLADASRAFAESGHNYQTVLDLVARKMAETVGDACLIRLVSNDGNWLELVALYHPEPEAAAFVRDVLAAEKYQRTDEGLTGRAVQTGQSILIPIISSEQLKAMVEPKLWALLDRFTIASLLIVPLLTAERVIGALLITRHQPGRPYTEDDQTLLQDLAGRAALAISNARLYQDVQAELTERKRAEEELKQTAAELARSNTDLEQFAYIVSHDLQEPLRAVTGTLQLLQKWDAGQLDARAEELIGHAVDGAARMRSLITDLLAYSRLGTRGQSLRRIEGTAILQDALANLTTAIRESQAVISHDPLPAVMADRTQLTQLFQNLIGNALKFRGDKPPVIHIRVEAKGAEWLFAVCDQGIGMEAQHFERIFGVFQRLHTRQEYAGTGIGLAVCKKIVERHGGHIWVESAVGQGSTFYFTLPAHLETDQLTEE